MNNKYIHILGSKISEKNYNQIGNKAKNLELLLKAGFQVPPGFCVTCEGMNAYLQKINLKLDFKQLTDNLVLDKKNSFREIEKIQKKIINESMPDELFEKIKDTFNLMNEKRKDSGWIARSSSPIEDSSTAAFAGMFDSFGGLFSFEQVIEGIKQCFASSVNDRLLVYLHALKLLNDIPVLSVLVQKIINADKAGVLFTNHPVTKNENTIIIEGTWGFCELLVGGNITPDFWQINKKTFEVQSSRIGSKKKMMILEKDGLNIITTPLEKKNSLCLNSKDIKKLIEAALLVENFFDSPQDIEWVISDETLWIVQSRPISNIS